MAEVGDVETNFVGVACSSAPLVWPAHGGRSGRPRDASAARRPPQRPPGATQRLMVTRRDAAVPAPQAYICRLAHPGVAGMVPDTGTWRG